MSVRATGPGIEYPPLVAPDQEQDVAGMSAEEAAWVRHYLRIADAAMLEEPEFPAGLLYAVPTVPRTRPTIEGDDQPKARQPQAIEVPLPARSHS